VASIPDLVEQAGQQLLVELIRNHKLQQSSGAIAQTLTAIETLFGREIPVYGSIKRQRIVLAQSITRPGQKRTTRRKRS
jgi:hypothetical protein